MPVSCALSLIQIIEGHKHIDFKKEVYCYTVPALVVGLIIVIKFGYLFNIKSIVGSFLILIGILRLVNFSDHWIRMAIIKGKNLVYLLIGFIHGISNLGGAPLTVAVSSIHNRQNKITVNIAFIYFILALSQLIVLAIFEHDLFTYSYLLLIPAVIISHFILNKLLFKNLDNAKFKTFINIVIVVFGIMCFI